jgi:hypothetical protein
MSIEKARRHFERAAIRLAAEAGIEHLAKGLLEVLKVLEDISAKLDRLEARQGVADTSS